MPDFIPVDHDPFAQPVSLIPVDHDPFSADGMIEQARAQLASQPGRLPPPDVGEPLIGDGGQFSEGTRWGNKAADIGSKLAYGAITGLATLPQRALEASAGDVQHLGEPGYQPQSVGPALEAATLPMGTGAIAGVPVRAGETVLGAGPIRAYHGSPHDFDHFDLSKIGTGEGAQAYGHGLYFAENPATAQAYRDQLSGKPISIPDADSPHFQQSLREAIANNAVQVSGRNVDIAKKSLTDQINRYPSGSYARKDYEAALDMLHENPAKYAGRMYEVNINADPAHFLDWDKPLAEMSPAIQSKLSDFSPHMSGAQINESARLVPGAYRDNRIATENLSARGIPGIKYLDQGSRAAGDGSRNYVVFNDKLIDIVRKYAAAGIALPPAIAAEYEQMRASQPAAQPNYTAGLR